MTRIPKRQWGSAAERPPEAVFEAAVALPTRERQNRAEDALRLLAVPAVRTKRAGAPCCQSDATGPESVCRSP